MTRRLLPFALALLTPAAAFAEHFHHHVEAPPDFVRRLSVCDKDYGMPNCVDYLNRVKLPGLSTKVDQARWRFEQGMTALYGFNYEDGLRNFRQATVKDPSFAMAFWGLAMAAAPNINIGQDEPCGRQAFDWPRYAKNRTAARPVTDLESGLIDAIVARYSDVPLDRVQAVDYAVAMRRVWQANDQHPQVGALNVESLLDLRPWALYDNAHRAATDTTEAVGGVAAGLRKQPPEAIGANHYLIHGVEAGPHPEAAKYSADLLSTAVPSSGHLLHMPSHTYLLMGDYGKAVDANTKAIDADNGRFAGPCSGYYQDYHQEARLPAASTTAITWRTTSTTERWPGLSLGLSRAGPSQDAQATHEQMKRFLANEPGLQRYMAACSSRRSSPTAGGTTSMRTKSRRQGRRRDVFLDSGCHILRSIWHWALGMARTRRCSGPTLPRRARSSWRSATSATMPPGRARRTWGNNSATAVLAIAEEVLRARYRLGWRTSGPRRSST